MKLPQNILLHIVLILVGFVLPFGAATLAYMQGSAEIEAQERARSIGLEFEATILDRNKTETSETRHYELVVKTGGTAPRRYEMKVDKDTWLAADDGATLWITVDPEEQDIVYLGKRAAVPVGGGSTVAMVLALLFGVFGTASYVYFRRYL